MASQYLGIIFLKSENSSRTFLENNISNLSIDSDIINL